MTDIAWVKITTSLPDDDKIKCIEAMPEGDSLCWIWIKLIIQAGKCNRDGFLYLSNDVPHTDESLSVIFRKPLNIVKLALETFIRMQMLEQIDGIYCLLNFQKHQNVAGMDKIREQTRNRVRIYRERIKERLLSQGNYIKSLPVASNNKPVTSYVTLRNAIEEEEEDIYTTTAKGDVKKFVEIYENNIGIVTPLILDEIKILANEYSDEWFSCAVKEACLSNAPKLKYVISVLERWRVEGFKSLKNNGNNGRNNYKGNGSSDGNNGNGHKSVGQYQKTTPKVPGPTKYKYFN